MVGKGFIITDIESLGLSQPPIVWLTYHLVVPTVAVLGMGVKGLPVPPVVVVYQSSDVPVADSGADGADWQ